MFPKQLIQKLEKKKEEDQFRTLKTFSKEIKDFCSNDYLGLAKQLKNQNLKVKIFEQPTTNNQQPISGGSTGSRLISGNSKETEQLESYLSEFYKADAALIFNSGYTANLSVLSCIPQKQDVIFYDEYVHASMRDGINLGQAKSYSFKHNQLSDLEVKLQKFGRHTNYIAVESLYSMDGDILDLETLTKVAETYNAYIILDEAHGTGILGQNFKGLYQKNNHKRIIARVHTFGKALGAHGAVVVGSEHLKDYLINYARPFIYTTALPNHTIQEIAMVHQIFEQDTTSKIQLNQNITYFLEVVNQFNLNTIVSQNRTPIQSIFGSIDNLKTIENKLIQHNFAVKLILSPTVPKGQERIRICLHSYNTKQEINELLEIVKHA